MICPNCGTHIKDGALRCPACHADLGMTITLPKISDTWCPTCGILIPKGSESCPHCGTPVTGPTTRTTPSSRTNEEAFEAAEHEIFDREATNVMARIESAVPAEPDPYDATGEHDHMPRTRVMVVAALAAVLVVGGGVLAITHPWNADAFSTRATEPADTSMAGYPGEVLSLSGQDRSAGSGESAVVSGDQTTYQTLLEIYQELGSLEKELEASAVSLGSVGISGTQEQRAAGLATQTDIAVRLSNAIARLDVVDVTSGTYVESRNDLYTLGNWLRNWSDALTQAWTISAGFEDIASHEEEVIAPLDEQRGTDGENAYRVYFDQNYGSWKPSAPSAG